MKKIFSLIIIIFGILIDQVFKNWVVANISLGQVRRFVSGLLSLTYLQNRGAAWSSFEGQQWFFYIITPIVLIVAGYFLWKNIQNGWYFIGLSLIISGALGNFIDRVRQGFVVDMFQTDFINFPIFNVADVLLSVGFVLLFVAILTEKESQTK